MKSPPEPMVQWAHACDYAGVGENSKPMLIGIFGSMQPAAFPAQYEKPFYCVYMLSDGQGQYETEIRVYGPENTVIATLNGPPIVIPHPTLSFLWAQLVQPGFPFPTAGQYRFVPVFNRVEVPEMSEVVKIMLHERRT